MMVVLITLIVFVFALFINEFFACERDYKRQLRMSGCMAPPSPRHKGRRLFRRRANPERIHDLERSIAEFDERAARSDRCARLLAELPDNGRPNNQQWYWLCLDCSPFRYSESIGDGPCDLCKDRGFIMSVCRAYLTDLASCSGIRGPEGDGQVADAKGAMTT